MKGAIETMMGIIMIAFMAVLSTAYITASLNTRSAQNYHTAVISEIEAGDFAQVVLDSCRQNAKDNGYDNLDIQKMSGDNGSYAKVTLTYQYTIPMLELFLEHEITGYAR